MVVKVDMIPSHMISHMPCTSNRPSHQALSLTTLKGMTPYPPLVAPRGLWVLSILEMKAHRQGLCHSLQVLLHFIRSEIPLTQPQEDSDDNIITRARLELDQSKPPDIQVPRFRTLINRLEYAVIPKARAFFKFGRVCPCFSSYIFLLDLGCLLIPF